MNRMKLAWSLLILGLALGGQGAPSAGSTSFQFKGGRYPVCRVANSQLAAGVLKKEWIEVMTDLQAPGRVELGRRIILRLQPEAQVQPLIQDLPVRVLHRYRDHVYILNAGDAVAALRAAAQLSPLPGVVLCYPEVKPALALQYGYGPAPDDTYYNAQWHLENRDPQTGERLGADLNARGAWAVTNLPNIGVAVADDGVEITHPDLVERTAGMPHYDFINESPGGGPTSSADKHATAVAGLLGATRNNGLGASGVALSARLATWKLFNGGSSSETVFPAMFEYASNQVAVQNHSWAYAGITQLAEPDPGLKDLINASIGTACTLGYGGKGSVLVRAAGNDRLNLRNVNDDWYGQDIRVVTVGASHFSGRVASMSNPGAPVLVGAPTSDGNYSLFTTDRQGGLGYNTGVFTNDLADYVFDGSFGGTSAAAGEISGVVALIRAANTNLTRRDVQQILVLASRHFDFADPDVATNGAGLVVSHNLGYGIPDAGHAVRLARKWTSRPEPTSVSFVSLDQVAVPDDGLRLEISNAPPELALVAGSPGLGAFPDRPTAWLPLVDIGLGTNTTGLDLRGKGAVMRRGTNTFAQKIQNAASAGASFAVICNNRDGSNRYNLRYMSGTDFSPIPALFITQTQGDNLLARMQQTNLVARALQVSTNYTFYVTNNLLCEHVTVSVDMSCRRSDSRLVLSSPMGTLSVLQRLNNDTSTIGGIVWTYTTTHHFYESSLGMWTVAFGDNEGGQLGTVNTVALTIHGVPIKDTDGDGLDDDWEMSRLGSLAWGARDDPDRDGASNAREQILQTLPQAVDEPFRLEFGWWDRRMARISWPGDPYYRYEVRNGLSPDALDWTNFATGTFPETECLIPSEDFFTHFFRAKAIPLP